MVVNLMLVASPSITHLIFGNVTHYTILSRLMFQMYKD